MRNVRLSLLTISTVLALFPFGGSVAFAQAVVPETCDADFHDLMRSRAWMESQRENEVAETLIKKPDSVFDVTCYSTHYDASKGIALFGEDLSSAADALIDTSGMTCSTMAALSEAVRCTDVDENTMFPDFDALISGDIRSCPSDSTRSDNWSAANDIVYPSTLPRATDAAGPDEFLSYLDNIKPLSCDDSAFIRTGLSGIVYLSIADGGSTSPINHGNITYAASVVSGTQMGPAISEGAVCVAPGCIYDAGDNKCVAP